MSIPSIPSSSYQIIIVLAIAYMFYENDVQKSRIDTLNNKQHHLDQSTNLFSLKRDTSLYKHDMEVLEKRLDYLTIYLKDTSTKKNLVDIETVSNSQENVFDSMTSRTDRYINALNQIGTYKIESEYIKKQLQILEEVTLLGVVGHLLLIFLCFYSFSFLMKEDLMKSKYLAAQVYEKRTYKYCQSCSRFFSALIKHGKEADGVLNFAFCEGCYNNGQYVNLDLTKEEVLKEMQQYKKWNYGKLLAKTRVERLLRWHKNPYKDPDDLIV